MKTLTDELVQALRETKAYCPEEIESIADEALSRYESAKAVPEVDALAIRRLIQDVIEDVGDDDDYNLPASIYEELKPYLHTNLPTYDTAEVREVDGKAGLGRDIGRMIDQRRFNEIFGITDTAEMQTTAPLPEREVHRKCISGCDICRAASLS
jgi:hypothetical protein